MIVSILPDTYLHGTNSIVVFDKHISICFSLHDFALLSINF